MIMQPPLELCNVSENGFYTIVDSNNNCLIEGNQYSADYTIPFTEEAEYIVQCCNAFPKAIELLKECLEQLTANKHEVLEVRDRINEFLTKLKENEKGN